MYRQCIHVYDVDLRVYSECGHMDSFDLRVFSEGVHVDGAAPAGMCHKSDVDVSEDSGPQQVDLA